MSNNEVLFSQPRNFAGLTSPHSNFKTAKAVILPVPYDSTTEWHSGSREGPRSIIDASVYLEWYDIELGKEIYTVGIHTLAELQPSFNSPEETVQRVYQAAKALLDKSKFIAMLGGEHSISVGAVKAYKEKYKNCSVLQLDAHADLRDEYMGTRYSHACAMRRIFELCPITQVGIRSMSLEEKEFIDRNNARPFLLSDTIPPALPVDDIIDSLSNDVYISIDLDVFDPSLMAAVSMPEPAGLNWREVNNLLQLVSRSKNVIGFDIVELCPAQGPAACSFIAAKLAYKLIGYSFFKS